MLLLVIIVFTATESKLRQDLPWEIVGRLELNSHTPRNALKTAAASLSRRSDLGGHRYNSSSLGSLHSASPDVTSSSARGRKLLPAPTLPPTLNKGTKNRPPLGEQKAKMAVR